MDVDKHDICLSFPSPLSPRMQLRHPNLVRLVDLFSSSAVPAPDPKDVYIVTEAMDCDLGALINSPWECSYELNGTATPHHRTAPHRTTPTAPHRPLTMPAPSRVYRTGPLRTNQRCL